MEDNGNVPEPRSLAAGTIMTNLETDLSQRLEALRRQNLYRQLRPIDSAQGPRLRAAGRSLVSFSSNDYLGLANHPALKQGAARAIAEFGAGSGASRLICGSLAPHLQLEDQLARFKNTPAALTFSSGYAAALGTLQALLEPDDVVILDKLAHACLVDAARLARAKMRVYAHNDLDELKSILQWADRRGAPSRKLIVTESVFSMDGDFVPLRDLVDLKNQHGAWLMLDEAHATGLFGASGRGWAEACQLSGQVEIQMGTLGKALGAAGGFIAGSRALVDYLINRARTFIFSTAPPPAASGAAMAGLELVTSAEGETLRQQLWARVTQVRTALAGTSWSVPKEPSAIVPLVVGEESAALRLSDQLRSAGYFLPAVRYPTVPRGSARLRLTLTAAHTPEDVRDLAGALADVTPNAAEGGA